MARRRKSAAVVEAPPYYPGDDIFVDLTNPWAVYVTGPDYALFINDLDLTRPEAEHIANRIAQIYPEVRTSVYSKKPIYPGPDDGIELKAILPQPRGKDGIFKKDDTRMWCPFCGEITRFVFNMDTNRHHCPQCSVSEFEFHTRTINHTWHVELKTFRGKRIRKRKTVEVLDDSDI